MTWGALLYFHVDFSVFSCGFRKNFVFWLILKKLLTLVSCLAIFKRHVWWFIMAQKSILYLFWFVSMVSSCFSGACIVIPTDLVLVRFSSSSSFVILSFSNCMLALKIFTTTLQFIFHLDLVYILLIAIFLLE